MTLVNVIFDLVTVFTKISNNCMRTDYHCICTLVWFPIKDGIPGFRVGYLLTFHAPYADFHGKKLST